MNELTTTQKALTAADIRAQVNLIQEVMKAVMKNGTHYGTIPGTPKPTLFKAGAEKLLMTFQLVSGDPKVEDLSTADTVRYRVTVPILTRGETLVGCGTGECSSDEEKYKWRRPVCDEEFDATPEDRRRIKWFKGKEKPYSQKQIRTCPADVANTVLKMAHKRGLVAGTLVTTGASDVFEQDIEDMPEELIHREEARPPVAMPTPRTAPESAPHAETPPATEPAQAATERPPLPHVEGLVEFVSAPKDGKRAYGVKLGGQWYNTLSATFAETAKRAKGEAKAVRIEYDVRHYGEGKTSNDILTIAVLGDAAEPAPDPAPDKDGNLPF